MVKFCKFLLTTGISQLISPKKLAEGWISVSYLGQPDWRGEISCEMPVIKKATGISQEISPNKVLKK